MLSLASLAESDRIAHGFFTREGGVSQGLFASLNCGLGSGDDPASVAGNRARVAERLGVAHDALATLYQIHSARVVELKEGDDPAERPQADALVTRRRGVALGILSADCVPLLFAAPEAGVVGAAHAGWKGARAGVAEATIEAMARLGAAPHQIRVGIGPAIQQRSYEVGPEFPGHFPGAGGYFEPAPRPGHFLFDLPGYLKGRLARLGLGAVEDLALDTAGDPLRFFSYRRSVLAGEHDYGRLISAIVLR